MERPYEAIPSYDELFFAHGFANDAEQKKDRHVSVASTSAFSVGETGDTRALLAVQDSRRPSSYIETQDRRLLGWRAGVTGVTALVASCLILNVSFMIWALTSKRVVNGIATLQQGSCATSANLNTAIHLGINLLSTGMLSGSNYCM